MTIALEAVDRVLSADTSDLQELARIARVAPEVLFLRADLSGLDLRAQNVEFLLPLETAYHNAVLTEQQRNSFKKAERQGKRRIKKKILDLRAELISRFIDEYDSGGPKLIISPNIDPISTKELQALLLDPLYEKTNNGRGLDSSYINELLEAIGPFVLKSQTVFDLGLFKLLGEIQCPVDKKTSMILEANMERMSITDLTLLIGTFRATDELDTFLIQTAEPRAVIQRAIDLGREGNIHFAAIEKAFIETNYWSWENALDLISLVPFDCNRDEAWRFSAAIISKNWPASVTKRILSTDTHPRISHALFHQVLAQGDEERVAELIRWLEDDRGAAGALSLENAFRNIKDFNLALKLARDLAPRLATNQISVIYAALAALATAPNDQVAVQAFHRRFVHS